MSKDKNPELYEKCMSYLDDQKEQEIELYKKCIIYLANQMDLDGYFEKDKLAMREYLTRLRELLFKDGDL